MFIDSIIKAKPGKDVAVTGTLPVAANPDIN